jgi:hypothetical protein
MQRFKVIRGRKTVALGVKFPDGSTVLWNALVRCTSVYPPGEALAFESDLRVEWVDELEAVEKPAFKFQNCTCTMPLPNHAEGCPAYQGDKKS